MPEWRVNIGDLAVQYHTSEICLVISTAVDPQGGLKILLLKLDETVWIDESECFRWQPLRFLNG